MRPQGRARRPDRARAWGKDAGRTGPNALSMGRPSKPPRWTGVLGDRLIVETGGTWSKFAINGGEEPGAGVRQLDLVSGRVCCNPGGIGNRIRFHDLSWKQKLLSAARQKRRYRQQQTFASDSIKFPQFAVLPGWRTWVFVLLMAL